MNAITLRRQTELTRFTKESEFSCFEDDPPNNEVVLDVCVLYLQALGELLLRLVGFYAARFLSRPLRGSAQN